MFYDLLSLCLKKFNGVTSQNALSTIQTHQLIIKLINLLIIKTV